MKIDWKSKLTSRKFWISICSFVSELLLAFNVCDTDVTKVTTIIMAGATAIAYVISEGLVDANRNNITTNEEQQ